MSIAVKAPFTKAETITPHDSNANAYNGFYVGGTGNVTLRAKDSSADVVLTALPVGAFVPIATSFIRATGTTATLLIGLKD